MNMIDEVRKCEKAGYGYAQLARVGSPSPLSHQNEQLENVAPITLEEDDCTMKEWKSGYLTLDIQDGAVHWIGEHNFPWQERTMRNRIVIQFGV